jgi:hypothetical protein
MDPLRLEASDNHDNQPATGATKTGGGWQEGIDEATTRPRRWATTNDEGVRRMVMDVMKRARMARAMVTAMRVPVNEEGKGGTGHGVDEGGVRQRDKEGESNGGKSNGNEGGGRATATRAMATEGEQQSTSNGINKGRWWLARERRRGDHTTMTVGEDER